MQQENQVIEMPADFDGVYRFTNRSEAEFKDRWDGIEYTFPPMKTTPLIIPGATPEEVQNIRKKFARTFAIAAFYESDKFKVLNQHTPGGTPALYTDDDLAPYIQMCLEPLPIAQAVMTKVIKDEDAGFKKDAKGKRITQVLDEGESLVGNGTVVG